MAKVPDLQVAVTIEARQRSCSFSAPLFIVPRVSRRVGVATACSSNRHISLLISCAIQEHVRFSSPGQLQVQPRSPAVCLALGFKAGLLL